MGRLIHVAAERPLGFQSDAMAKGERGKEERKGDDPLTRVAKLVPTEIVAGYIPLVAAAEAITDKADLQFTLACVAFGVGVLVTPLYLISVGKPQSIPQRVSIVVSTIAFVLWAYLLGGAFEMKQMETYLGITYDKRIASFVVGVFTWVVGLFPYEKLLPRPTEP